MALINSIKNSCLGDIGFTTLFFKQVKATDFEALADELTAFLYENPSAGIWSVFVSGPADLAKSWNKLWTLAMGEINWPVYWYPVNESQTVVSGYISCVNQHTIKTINGAKFISKILDSPNLRMALVCGNDSNKSYFKDAKLLKQSADMLQQGLLFAGLKTSSIRKILSLTSGNIAFVDLLQKELALVDPVNGLSLTFVAEKLAREQLCLTAIEAKNPDLHIQHFQHSDALQETTLTWIGNNTGASLYLNASIRVNHGQEVEAIKLVDAYLSKHSATWLACYRGVIYATDTKILKGLKDVLKERQIPRAALLLLPVQMPDKQDQIFFDCDFNLGNTL
jgi:hypothetical protein